MSLLSNKPDEELKGKFYMLEPYHVFYVLLAAHLLAVLFSPTIFGDSDEDELTVRDS